MEDSNQTVPSFSNFSFSMIGRNSLFNRISNGPSEGQIISMEEVEDDVDDDMDIDDPEPPNKIPTLLGRIGDRFPASVSPTFRPVDPLPRRSPALGPPASDTSPLPNGIPGGGFVTLVRCQTADTSNQPPIQTRVEINLSPMVQRENEQRSFRRAADNFGQCSSPSQPPLEQLVNTGLPTPPPSASVATSGLPRPASLPRLLSATVQLSGSAPSLYAYPSLDQLLQEELAAWSEVLETKKNRATSGTCKDLGIHSASHHSPILQDERTDASIGSYRVNTSKISLPQDSKRSNPPSVQIPRDGGSKKSLSTQAERNEDLRLDHQPSSSRPISSKAPFNGVLADAGLGPAKATHPAMSLSDTAPTQKTYGKVDGVVAGEVVESTRQPDLQPSIQALNGEINRSPREEELKTLLRSRRTSNVSESIDARENSQFEPERCIPVRHPVPVCKSPQYEEEKTFRSPVDSSSSSQCLPDGPFSIASDSASQHVLSQPETQNTSDDTSEPAVRFSDRSSTFKRKASQPPSPSANAGINQALKRQKTTKGWPRNAPEATSEPASDAAAKRVLSPLGPAPDIASVPPGSAGTPLKTSSSTSAGGNEAKAPVIVAPGVKMGDGGRSSHSNRYSPVRVKKEEQDIKIRIKVEEDLKNVLMDNSDLKNTLSNHPGLVKKEEPDNVTHALFEAETREQRGNDRASCASSRFEGVNSVEQHRDPQRKDSKLQEDISTSKPGIRSDQSPQIAKFRFQHNASLQQEILAEVPPSRGLAITSRLDSNESNDRAPGERRDTDKGLEREFVPGPTSPAPSRFAPEVPFPTSRSQDAVLRQFEIDNPADRADTTSLEIAPRPAIKNMQQRDRSPERTSRLHDHWSPPRNRDPVRARLIPDTYRPPLSPPKCPERGPRRMYNDYTGDLDQARLRQRCSWRGDRWVPSHEYALRRSRSVSPRRSQQERARNSRSPPRQIPSSEAHSPTLRQDPRLIVPPIPLPHIPLPHVPLPHVPLPHVSLPHVSLPPVPLPPVPSFENHREGRASPPVHQSSSLSTVFHATSLCVPSSDPSITELSDHRAVPFPFPRITEDTTGRNIGRADSQSDFDAVTRGTERKFSPSGRDLQSEGDRLQSSTRGSNSQAPDCHPITVPAPDLSKRVVGTLSDAEGTSTPSRIIEGSRARGSEMDPIRKEDGSRQSDVSASDSVQHSSLANVRPPTPQSLSSSHNINRGGGTLRDLTNKQGSDKPFVNEQEGEQNTGTDVSFYLHGNPINIVQDARDHKGKARIPLPGRDQHQVINGQTEESGLQVLHAEDTPRRDSQNLPKPTVSSRTPVVGPLPSPPSQSDEQDVAKPSHHGQSQPPRPDENRRRTSDAADKVEDTPSRRLVQRIGGEPSKTTTVRGDSDSEISLEPSRPQSPIPALSSRLGDIFIDHKSSQAENRIATKPPSSSDNPLSSRITDAKPRIRRMRYPLPPKPAQNPPNDNTREAPQLLKRLTSDKRSSVRLSRSQGGRGAGSTGRGRGRGDHYSPHGDTYSPSARSKPPLEDRLS